MIDFSRFQFHPVIELPAKYDVYDFSQGYDPERPLSSSYGIGRYDEDRRGMYSAAIFTNGENPRTIHMGIDIAAPVGTQIHAFYSGEIFLFAYNAAKGDYGYTLITKHDFGGVPLFALFGHLSKASLEGKKRGSAFATGDILSWVGDRHENGGWNAHLHFQLSLEEPIVCDLPGVVSAEQREKSLSLYPDPRLVLGPLY